MSLQLIDNKNDQKKQSGLEENKSHWQDVFDVLIPISIENLRIENSSLYFTNTNFAKPLPIRLEEVYIDASNLRSRSKDLASPFYMRAILQQHAPLQMKGKMSILADPRQYDVDFQLEKFNITSLNQLLLHYIPLNITSGEASFYGEAKSETNNMKGYVKIFFKDGDIIAPDQKFVSGRHSIYEILSAFGNWILKNNKTHKVAAHIPFEYTKGKFSIDGSEAFWSAVKNSWNEMKPGLDKN